MSVRSRIRFALVGCGDHSHEVIIPTLQNIAGVKCIFVSDLDKSKSQLAAQRLGEHIESCDWYNRIDHEELDCVICVGSPQLHVAVAHVCHSQNIPIFVEKPPSVNIEELKDLDQKFSESSLFNQIGHNLRFSSAATEFVRLIDRSNDSGFLKLNLSYFGPRPRGDRWGLEDPRRSFLLSHATHAIDYAIFLCGVDRLTLTQSKWHEKDGLLCVSFSVESLSGKESCDFLISNAGGSFDFDVTAVTSADSVLHQKSTKHIRANSTQGRKRWFDHWESKILQAGHDEVGYFDELNSFFEEVRSASGKSISANFRSEICVYEIIEGLLR